MKDDDLFLVAIALIGFGYLSYVIADNSEFTTTQLSQNAQLKAIQDKYKETCIIITSGEHILKSVAVGEEFEMTELHTILEVLPADMQYFSLLEQSHSDLPIIRDFREMELIPKLRTLYEALIDIRDSEKGSRLVSADPKLSMTLPKWNQTVGSLQPSPSAIHAWASSGEAQATRNRQQFLLSQLEGGERQAAEIELQAAHQRNDQNTSLAQSEQDKQYQEAKSIHDQSAHQKEDLFGDIEQAKRDEDIAKVDGHIEHKIPETPAQGIAQEALEKIGMGTGGRMMDLARSSEIPDGIALIQEGMKALDDKENRLQDAMGYGNDDRRPQTPNTTPPKRRDSAFTDPSSPDVIQIQKGGEPVKKRPLTPPLPPIAEFNEIQNPKRLIDGLVPEMLQTDHSRLGHGGDWFPDLTGRKRTRNKPKFLPD
jgi:hypothetical protein